MFSALRSHSSSPAKSSVGFSRQSIALAVQVLIATLAPLGVHAQIIQKKTAQQLEQAMHKDIYNDMHNDTFGTRVQYKLSEKILMDTLDGTPQNETLSGLYKIIFDAKYNREEKDMFFSHITGREEHDVDHLRFDTNEYVFYNTTTAIYIHTDHP